MIQIIVLILIVGVLFAIDLSTAISFANKKWNNFRRYEANKALVWALEQDKAKGNNEWLKYTISNAIINMLILAVGIGLVGMLFNVSFTIGVRIALILQAVTNFFGIMSNLVGVQRKEEKNGS